jgi:hypothetical protein
MSTNLYATPPGFNKHQRDVSKILLAGTSFCLLTGMLPAVSVVLSAVATIFVKQGTAGSVKNLKWLVLSVLSFLASLVSSSMLGGQALVDEERAYELKFKLWFAGRLIQTVWGGILALFVFSALSSDTTEHTQTIQQMKHR